MSNCNLINFAAAFVNKFTFARWYDEFNLINDIMQVFLADSRGKKIDDGDSRSKLHFFRIYSNKRKRNTRAIKFFNFNYSIILITRTYRMGRKVNKRILHFRFNIKKNLLQNWSWPGISGSKTIFSFCIVFYSVYCTLVDDEFI